MFVLLNTKVSQQQRADGGTEEKRREGGESMLLAFSQSHSKTLPISIYFPMAKLCCQLLRGKVRTCVCNSYRCLGLASKIWSRRCLMTNANHKRRRQLKMLCKSVRAKSNGNALARVLSWPGLSFPVLSCPILSRLVLYCRVLAFALLDSECKINKLNFK